jgi:hypothetical protein
MNVTPEMDAPIIPYATTGHGAFLSPEKNELEPAFLPVTQEMTNNNKVYAAKATRKSAKGNSCLIIV